jgi:probable HAF family extracellular repeat protein
MFFLQANAINNAGTVVGTTEDANYQNRAFRYANGTTTLLPLPAGASASNAYAINSTGTVVGDNNNTDALLWDPDNTVHDLGPGPAGFSQTTLTAINDAGVAVGYGLYDSTTWEAVLYSGGVFYNLSDLVQGWPGPGPLELNFAYGINNSGQIAGTAGSYGFILDPVGGQGGGGGNPAPEPATLLLTCAGLCVAGLRWVHRRLKPHIRR